MTRTKVCGITNADDAAVAASCGAHAIGVIFVRESPRYMGNRLRELPAIVEAAGPFVTLVAVVRNLSEVAELPSGLFGAVQYYHDDLKTEAGERSSGVSPAIGMKRIRVQRMDGTGSDLVAPRNVDAVLLDTYDPARLGGSGRAFEWQSAAAQCRALRKPIIVAGGLTSENVGDAIASLRPYAVDVSSGVERSPGTKDASKVMAFLDAVRRADSIRSEP
ncbi:MAG: phosphoribosylanthranilate isomerase, partial [Armatimonadetes bacterium]|nr:phosphoribosylanthranilate isomerase [Armatimonadota bacterium]